jgi:glycosyltransferase involved in cell wall biosynthesis
VPALAAATRKHGPIVSVRTVTWSDVYEPNELPETEVHPLSQLPFSGLTKASSSLREALQADAEQDRILHVHGLWQMPNVYPAWQRRRYEGVRLIHAPRGMLGAEALRISAWKKKPFWWLLQRSALQNADCLHATAHSEYEEIRQLRIETPVAIIPNGIDLPDRQDRVRKGAERVVLSLGRLHPKKGLDRLIRAWSGLEAEFPDWTLRISGPAELGYDAVLRELSRSLATKRVQIDDAVYGEKKLEAFRSADLFVLPSLNENFALTVAEALASEIPVMSTKGAPWAGLERERCGWWIDHGVEPLASALRSGMSLRDEERSAMGARGRAWMARDFGWDRIAREMVEVYSWLKFRTARPSCVQLA